MRFLLRLVALAAASATAFAVGAWAGATGAINIAQHRARQLAATHQAINLHEDDD